MVAKMGSFSILVLPACLSPLAFTIPNVEKVQWMVSAEIELQRNGNIALVKGGYHFYNNKVDDYSEIE